MLLIGWMLFASEDTGFQDDFQPYKCCGKQYPNDFHAA